MTDSTGHRDEVVAPSAHTRDDADHQGHDHEGHDHEGHDEPHGGDADDTALEFWERLYSEQGQRWSGSPNQRLVEIVTGLAPGRALDLGSGEGGDAVWLAQQGWVVTAVDVSPTALARLITRADEEGVADRIETVAIDLAAGFPEVPEGGWDLVSAQFFQSTIELPRTDILRRGVAATAHGGLFLLVEHGEAPAGSPHHDVVFPTVDETLAELALPPGEWTPVRVERSTRHGRGPDGDTHELVDNIIAVKRA